MKIGILTFHNANNYGAVLQCYALQEALKSIGHEVYVIDYRNPHTEKIYKPTPLSHFIRCWLHNFKIEPWMKVQAKKYKKRYFFNKFRKTYLNITKKRYYRNNIPTNYDAYVIGSDQLWNECCTIKFEPIYFGDFKRSSKSKLYGYAISANSDTVDNLSPNELRTIANRFDMLSFREQDTSDLILKKANILSRIDIDPTLLYSQEFWNKLASKKYANKKYVLVYELVKNQDNPDVIINKAKTFAKSHNLEVINLSAGVYSLHDFISLLKYASCVFTSSFHGTVYSLIFNRPIYAFKTGSVRDERYISLLSNVGATNILQNFDDNQNEYPKLNYNIINRLLEEQRQLSLTYIKQM